jgi:hypothetical protein
VTRSTSLLLPALLLLALPAPALAAGAGDALITELMLAPQSTREWVELLNTSGGELDLAGCRLRDGDGVEALLSTDLLVADGDRVLLGQGPAACLVYEDSELEACALPVDAKYAEDLLDGGAAGSIALVCDGGTVDEVAYDWAVHAPRCLGNGLCSVNRSDEQADADWAEGWCIPPATTFGWTRIDGVDAPLMMIATPGAQAECAPETCGPGDVLFTEFMMVPPNPAYRAAREWIELKAIGRDCDLHGCMLREGPFDDPLHDPTDPQWKSHLVAAEGNTMPLLADAYSLFADPAAGWLPNPVQPDQPTTPVYTELDITLLNNDPRWIHLSCGDQVLDSAPYDWSRFAPGCNDDACSVNLPAEREADRQNDTLDDWCLAPSDLSATLPKTDVSFTGTPGAPGACLTRDWPLAGEVLFTELMISPLSGDDGTLPEWFEVTNVADRPVDLALCELRRTRWRDDGTLDPFVLATYVLPDPPVEAQTTVLEIDQVQLFSKGDCIDGSEPQGGLCPDLELIYESLSFTTERELVELLCPDGAAGTVVVDAVTYDSTLSANRAGMSLEFDPNQADAAALNDAPAQWCEASHLDCFMTNDLGECNYGSPGVVQPCQTDGPDVPPSGAGARCQAMPASGGALGLLVLMLGALGIRRR